MRTRQLHSNGTKIWALVFDKGDKAPECLLQAAKDLGIDGGSFTAIGAFRQVTLGFFDGDKKDYIPIPVEEQVEVLSMVGNVATQDGETKLHTHVVVGKRDGTAHGGHLLSAEVWPTLEVILTESPGELTRKFDPETDLPLLDL